jgi:hypothetical protein
MRPFVAVSWMLLACGGKSVDEEQTATRNRGPISSREAFDAIRAELPPDVRVLVLRQSPLGTLQPDGRDERWIVEVSVGADVQHGWVQPSGMSIDVTLESVDAPECSSTGLVEVDSAVAVPDALARVNDLALSLALRDAESVPHEYWQQAPCRVDSTAMVFTRTGHLLHVRRSGPDWVESFFAHYGDAGELVEFCGPCDTGLFANCSNCTRG